MEIEKVNSIATSVIAFVTVISLMVGIYYNAKSFNTKTIYVLFTELLFLIMVVLFGFWIFRKTK